MCFRDTVANVPSLPVNASSTKVHKTMLAWGQKLGLECFEGTCSLYYCYLLPVVHVSSWAAIETGTGWLLAFLSHETLMFLNLFCTGWNQDFSKVCLLKNSPLTEKSDQDTSLAGGRFRFKPSLYLSQTNILTPGHLCPKDINYSAVVWCLLLLILTKKKKSILDLGNPFCQKRDSSNLVQ